MGAQTKITITHDGDLAADLQNKYQVVNASLPKKQTQLIEQLVAGLGMGSRNGSMITAIDDGAGVNANGTVTFSSLANNDTVTIAGVVFTAKTSGASGAAQFNLGANDTAAAVNFAAAVNAHTTLTLLVTASPAAAVTTITCVQKGTIGNFLTIAISAHGSVSGSGLLTSGTNSAALVSITTAYGV